LRIEVLRKSKRGEQNMGRQEHPAVKAKKLVANFGPRLRELRQHRGWSMPMLETKSGVLGANISDLEINGTEPTWTTVLKLALALDINPMEFTTPAGNLPPHPDLPKAGRPIEEPDWSKIYPRHATQKTRAASLLRNLRLQRHHSQAAVGKLIGADQAKVSAMERGQAALNTILHAIEMLGGDVSEFAEK